MTEGLAGDVTWIAAAGGLIATLIAIAVELGLLAVALGPVRRHRPDASGLVTTSALVLLATSLCSPLMHAALPMLSARESTQAMITASAVASILVALMHAAGFALLIAAIARLAAPARNDPRDPS